MFSSDIKIRVSVIEHLSGQIWTFCGWSCCNTVTSHERHGVSDNRQLDSLFNRFMFSFNIPHHRPFVRGIRGWPMDSHHKGPVMSWRHNVHKFVFVYWAINVVSCKCSYTEGPTCKIITQIRLKVCKVNGLFNYYTFVLLTMTITMIVYRRLPTPLKPCDTYVHEKISFTNPTMHLSHIPQYTTLEQKYVHCCSNAVYFGIWDRCIVPLETIFSES